MPEGEKIWRYQLLLVGLIFPFLVERQICQKLGALSLPASLALFCDSCLHQLSTIYYEFFYFRSSEDTFRDFLFQQLGGLIAIVRQHVRNYLDSIFDLIMVKNDTFRKKYNYTESHFLKNLDNHN